MNGKAYFQEVLEWDFKKVNMTSPDLPDYRFQQLAEEWVAIRKTIPFLNLLKPYELTIKYLSSNNAHIKWGEEIVLQPSKFSAFVHELGHVVDDSLKEGEKRISSLKEFKSVKVAMKKDTSAYIKRKNIRLNPSKETYIRSTVELFARAFEYYVWGLGIMTSYNKSEKEKRRISIDAGYHITPATKILIKQYFDILLERQG